MKLILTNSGVTANCLLALGLLALPGCTYAPWERDFWHPPAASGAAPIEEGQAYPMTRATGENLPQNWPNLGDVPARTAAPVSETEEAEMLLELESDRRSATEVKTSQPVTAAKTDLRIPDNPPVEPSEP